MGRKCSECGASYILANEGLVLQEYCKLGHPPRAEVVQRGVPKWMVARINKAYGLHLRTVRDVAMWFDSGIVSTGCFVGFLDHYGHDFANNFICEPYGGKCKGCHRDAEKFAAKIGAKLTIAKFNYHAPWSDLCIRMTFSEMGTPV